MNLVLDDADPFVERARIAASLPRGAERNMGQSLDLIGKPGIAESACREQANWLLSRMEVRLTNGSPRTHDERARYHMVSEADIRRTFNFGRGRRDLLFTKHSATGSNMRIADV